MKNGKIIGVSQDKNRKQVLLLAAICAIAIKIPSYFIYQKELKDLRDMKIKILVIILFTLQLY